MEVDWLKPPTRAQVLRPPAASLRLPCNRASGSNAIGTGCLIWPTRTRLAGLMTAQATQSPTMELLAVVVDKDGIMTMTLTTDEISKVQAVLVDALGVDDDEVTGQRLSRTTSARKHRLPRHQFRLEKASALRSARANDA